ncbi:flowering time control protein FPA-like isoform X1 [Cucurbita moschata]|uniref:Flowering time control protein FPA-like isoform X1 n=2 Tax=Cucurbita moschata TaxID=3662 RepID=A0A6J1H746_CUCMO|nr:flowering time control protein FPA-like isoform X1 [Cucurbita moschata]
MSRQQLYRDSDVTEMSSNSLWVGNLSMDVTDTDLMNMFAQFGAIDSVSSYPSRSYAFIFFKHMEDAQAAKEALQGVFLRGSSIKIEFARPAKPCRNLWVGGISPAVSREQLEEEFSKFGKIDEFKFLRDRNTAFIEYVRLEDASQALRIMNGKRIGGDQIRVDFLRSQPMRRDQWPDSRDGHGQLQGRNVGMADFQSGYKRPLHTQSSELRRDGPPSKVLWIGYPPSVQIDEQMLHNAMILFGEIERITSFHSRHFAFVEFRSVDEARRAKEGLQGRLFNDPRITIMFSNSDPAPVKEHPGFYPGGKETRPEMFFNEHQIRPPQMDMLGHPHPMVQNKFPGPLPANGILGPNTAVRPPPFGPPQGISGPPEFNDFTTSHGFHDANSKNVLGPNWRRPSPPAPGILSSPATGIRPPPPVRSTPNSWDVLDVNQFQRDSKRSRIDGPSSLDDASFPPRKMDNRGMGFDQQYGVGPLSDGGSSVSYTNAPVKTHAIPIGARAPVSGQSHGDNDFIWRGIIAKGGTPVCHARCVPIGEGIGSDLPEAVNCSARTGLDQLAKHYAEATGFDIVFFLPDSEDDFASYTEFLRYLGAKNRAGVAKFDDGTTMFLVPPSEFLRKVLKVAGPERLYGLILKFPQVPLSESTHQQSYLPIPTSDYGERQQVLSSRAEYGSVPSKQEQLLPMDYNRVLHEETKEPPKPLLPASEPPSVQSLPHEYVTNNNTAAVSQAGLSLTPELIATLVSLLPGKTQSSSLESAKQPAISPQPPMPTVDSNKGTTSEGWIGHQSSELTGQPFQQMENHFNSQGQSLSQFQPYPPLPQTPNQHAPQIMGATQIQDAAVGLPQQQHVPIPYRPLSTYSAPPENAQASGLPFVNPQYQHDVSQINQRGYGSVNEVDTSGYGAPVVQQSTNTATLSNQGQGSTSQPQPVTHLASDRGNPELPYQMEHLQSANLGAGNGTSDVEAGKDQRYRSTLQFAANLLLQIQQQQQQPQQAGWGSGNQ